MNKTLYLKDDDVAVWDRARELAGEKLSPVVMDALRGFVAEQERIAGGWNRIVVNYDDSLDKERPKAKAFTGRWIISNDEPSEEMDSNGHGEGFAIAETAKGKVVVLHYLLAEGERYHETFNVFDSFDDAASVKEFRSAVNQAVRKRGVPIEELDI